MLIEDVASGGRRRVEIARPLAAHSRKQILHMYVNRSPICVYILSHSTNNIQRRRACKGFPIAHQKEESPKGKREA
jgi:hypothetical protein